ncbi:MAG: dephospho-CoA kinase [Clostridia bacterium]|nr:dephospho-CoA kinase [Clostridia bacterium]
MIIGITGKSGTGKSSICEELEKRRGFLVIDADKIVKELQSKKSKYLQQIINLFGKDIINDKGELDRKKLANIIFNDKEEKKKIDEVTFKYIGYEILRKINENEGRDIVIDAPLLIEAGYNEFCDLVFYIKADEKSQIERICKRDNIDETAAKTRLSAQNNEEYSMKYADYMIVNDSLDKAVDEILEKIDNV